MHRRLAVPFLLMGVSFTVLQTLMIRELLVSFSGNELSIGFILGAWLVLEALGSGLAGHWIRRIPPRPASYAWLQLMLALLLLPSLLVAMHVRTLVGAVPGEAIAPPGVFLASLLVLAPLGLVDGAMFTTACRVRLWAARASAGPFAPGTVEGPANRTAGYVYVLEAAGSIVGGVVLTYLLLPWLSSTGIILLVAALNLASALSLFLLSPRRRLLAGLLAGLLFLLALIVLVSPLASALHRNAVAGRWAPYHLVYESNSAYGNVAIIQEYGQITLFENGTPVFSIPDPNVATTELLTHLPLLFLDQKPRNVLVIGGGAGGVLQELLRYPLERVDYAELDPLLIQSLQEVPSPLTERELSNPRLHLALEDGRRFVQRQLAGGATPPYDLILLNLPYPSTLVLNRLYTHEFLDLAGSLLAPGGLLVLPAPPARTYVGPALGDLLACYAHTLETVFPHVRAIPADELTLWLASLGQPLDLETGELVRRWEERGPDTAVLQADYLRYLLDEGVQARFSGDLAGRTAEVNRDGHPAGLRYSLAYESALLSPGLEPFFRTLGRLRWTHLAGGIALLVLAGLFLARRQEFLVSTAIVSTGLFGMATDVLIIFAFQVLYGYVYQQVGLLITAFMAGLSIGGLAMMAWVGRLRQPWRVLTVLELAITVAGVGLAGVLALLFARPILASPLVHGLLLAMNVLAGALVGLEFPLANHILRQGGQEGGRVAGLLYAYDLVGATVGAVVVSAVLLPALGLVETALLVALFKAGSLLLVGSASWRGSGRAPSGLLTES